MPSAIEPIQLIQKYYQPESQSYEILIIHSEMVKAKALEIAERLGGDKVDRVFLAEAAMLHDIGIFKTHSPRIGCFGEAHYLCHGVLGREILEAEGLPKHALVCERHTGIGLTRADIKAQNLPLPDRDMLPLTLEEQIICYADCFFSKNPQKLREPKSIKKLRSSFAKWGDRHLNQLNQWIDEFGS